MNLFTKVWNYLQDLNVYNGKNRGETIDEDVMAINRLPTERSSVYTPKTGVYDWEREEAKLRHPSNYKNRSKK